MDNLGIHVIIEAVVFCIFYRKGNWMKNNRHVFQAFTMVMQFGLNMLVPIVLCTLLGVWLGDKFDIPIVTVPLFIVGALAGFRNVFIMAKKIYQDDDKDN